MKFNTRDWSRSIQRCFPLHWNTLDHGTLELDLFGLSCTQIVRSSPVQPSHLMHARMHMHSAANGWCNAGTGPAGRIDRIKKCLADAEARRGRESRAMNGRGEEGDRGARHGSRRRDSPGPLKSETAQSSCPPPPCVQASTPPFLVRFGLCADPRSSPLSYSSYSFEKPPLPQPRLDGTPLQSPVAPTLSLLLCFSSTSKGVVGLNFASRGSLVAISARNVVTFPSFFRRAYLLR